MAWFIGFWLCAGCLFLLELLVPAFHQEPARKDRWPTNFGFGLVNAWVMAIAPLSTISSAEWASQSGVGLLNQVALPLWVSVGCTLALYSLTSYLIHVRAAQNSMAVADPSRAPLGHPSRRVDESASSPTGIDSQPGVLGGGRHCLWAQLVGSHHLCSHGTFINFFSHANIRLPERVDRILRWVFITPNMHSLHHSSYQPETDSNYGTVFTLWDRIFGTYRAGPASGYGKLQIGLKEIRDDRAWRFWWQMKSPALLLNDTRRTDG